MKFKKYMKIKKRICDNHCHSCPFSEGAATDCVELELENPKRAKKIAKRLEKKLLSDNKIINMKEDKVWNFQNI